MTDIIVGLILAGIAALAVRSLWMDRRKGKSCSCSGDCSQCRGCH